MSKETPEVCGGGAGGAGSAGSYRNRSDALSAQTAGTYRKISATQDVLAEELANIVQLRKHPNVGKWSDLCNVGKTQTCQQPNMAGRL